MKILLITGNRYPCSNDPLSGIFMKRHAEAFSKYFDIVVLSVDTNYEKDYVEIHKKDFTEIIISVRRIRSKLFNFISFFKAYFRGMKIVNENWGRPNLIILMFSFPISIPFYFWNLFRNRKYAIIEHWSGFLDGSFERKSIFFKIITRKVIHKASLIMTVSNTLKEGMLSLGLEGNYGTLPNVAEYVPADDSFQKTKKYLLHISSMKDHQKNVSGIIRVIKRIHRKRDDFELHLIGGDNDLTSLIKEAKEDKDIIFHGRKYPLKDYYSACDFFILNSNVETFSVVVAEALVYGKPVIITNCGGPEEYVDTESGIIIQKHNEEELENAIEYMLSNLDKYDNQKIAKKYRKMFSKETIGVKFKELVENL